ncbi:signal peptidase II [Anaeropeptidivorans aminofermentans]|jgi:signal peptidase II|uniref:signal peptidase II n=1 Tax=Anaeropeptidivorans aminofermentans TaxID=2934315 RepID=UPI002024B88A|nr:signal peptidase II [Anaeropeptidivorans aminofermentans]MBE6011308.1 signal peptidase II [Lachnospiraceae bacterium]
MIFLLILAIIFVLDMLSKHIISKRIKEGQQIEVIKNKFYITHIKNKGAAYGMLSENRGLLLLSSIGSLVILSKLFFDALKNGKSSLTKASLAMVLGGGLGNIYDRIFKKEVTDFLYVKYKKAPIFNIADVFVALGITLLFVKELFSKD